MRKRDAIEHDEPEPTRWRWWSGDDKPFYAAMTLAFLIGLGVFAYFASVVGTFPGEVRASTWVQSLGTPWLDTVMKAVSSPGGLAIAGPIVLVASAGLYAKGWRSESILILASAGVGRLASFGLKEMVTRPRPPEDLVRVLQETDSYSFPSGHAMHYAVFLGTLAVILAIRMNPGPTLRAIQAMLLLALLAIGLSRIYLGMHWAGDVVGGYAFGAGVVIVAIWVWSRWTRGRHESASR